MVKHIEKINNLSPELAAMVKKFHKNMNIANVKQLAEKLENMMLKLGKQSKKSCGVQGGVKKRSGAKRPGAAKKPNASNEKMLAMLKNMKI